jgi:hypothetical protein
VVNLRLYLAAGRAFTLGAPVGRRLLVTADERRYVNCLDLILLCVHLGVAVDAWPWEQDQVLATFFEV